MIFYFNTKKFKKATLKMLNGTKAVNGIENTTLYTNEAKRYNSIVVSKTADYTILST